jgi:hypothetical protein
LDHGRVPRVDRSPRTTARDHTIASPDAESRYRKALALLGSRRMRHDQYGITIDPDWVRARLVTPFRR